MNKLAGFISVFFLLINLPITSGQPAGKLNKISAKTRILFVLDASGSMADYWQSDSKYHIAIRVLTSILDSLRDQKNMEIGLRVYGPKRSPGPDCHDSYLMVPFGKESAQKISAILRDLKPGGTTPITYSVEQATKDFPACDSCRNLIVLITDGLEACGGDPCKVSLELQHQGIFLRPFIVGIGQNMKTQFDCMGTYYDASGEKGFKESLDDIVSSSLKPSTVQIDLLDGNGQPLESNLPIFLYDHMTRKAKYHFIHTLNEKGLPDTLVIDPLITYDVVVHTVPPVQKDSIYIPPGRHSIIPIETPQGYLGFSQAEPQPLECIIRRAGSGRAIHIQQTDRFEKYLAGNYDITVLTLPRTNFENVHIDPADTLMLRIPKTGMASIQPVQPVFAYLYMEQGKILLWVCNLLGNVEPERLKLQPGAYRIIYRMKTSANSSDTREKSFRIESGSTTEVKLEND